MLIGRRISIKDAKNHDLIGKQGTVIDETKHTITLKTTTSNSPTKSNSPSKNITIIKEQIITIEESP